MFTGIFLVFIGGWLTWFWIDKPPAGQFRLPPSGDSLVEDFQRSIDLLKAGHPDMAYLYIWHAHYLILSVVLGILTAVVFRSIADHLSRKSRRRLYYPPPVAGTSARGQNASTERPAVPADDDKMPVENGSNDRAAP
jgi:hypothetical protein